eukprot:GHVO01015263.1.p2 GENE.GHVO01015263.1~~GHVO01015263.1.p2  ORF type:complete len:112 (-),score=8.94 GHVO01015263.1:219-554(-)
MGGMRDTIRHFAEAQAGCPVAYVYSHGDVRRLLAPHFQARSITKSHIFTYDIDAYKQGRLEKDAAWKDVSDRQLSQLERELGWHTLVVARPGKPSGNRHRRRRPRNETLKE